MRQVSKRRLRSCAVLLVWLASLAGPLLISHSDAPDVACGDVALSPHVPDSFAEAAAPPASEEHCDLCHLQRIVRGVFAGTADAARAAGVQAAPFAVLTQAAPSAVSRQLPPRAPPALL